MRVNDRLESAAPFGQVEMNAGREVSPLQSPSGSNDELPLAYDVTLNNSQQACFVQSGLQCQPRVKGVERKPKAVPLVRLRLRTAISRTFALEIRRPLNDPGEFCGFMNNLIAG